MEHRGINRQQVFVVLLVVTAFLAGFGLATALRPGVDDTAAPSDPSAPTTSSDEQPSIEEGTPTTAPPPTTEQPTTTARRPEVFVDPAGSDSNDGTANSPVATTAAAIALAVPGDTIFFAPGVYPPALIEGVSDLSFMPAGSGDDVTFTSGNYDTGSAIWVLNSSGIEIRDLVATNSWSGILVQESSDVLITGVTVSNTGQEAIAVQHDSFNVTIENSDLSMTGQRPGELDGVPFSNFGEGIYLGTGGVREDGSIDLTHDLVVQGNTIHSTTAEAVDIKPSVLNVVVRDNVIYDVSTATSGAIVSGIGVRVYPDPQVVIERNVIFQVTRTSPYRDGTAISVSSPATVRANVIWNTQHYGILVDRNLLSENGGEVVIEDNFVAGSGLEPIRVNAADTDVEILIGENTLDLPLSDFIDVESPDFLDQALALVLRLDAGENISSG